MDKLTPSRWGDGAIIMRRRLEGVLVRRTQAALSTTSAGVYKRIRQGNGILIADDPLFWEAEAKRMRTALRPPIEDATLLGGNYIAERIGMPWKMPYEGAMGKALNEEEWVVVMAIMLDEAYQYIIQLVNALNRNSQRWLRSALESWQSSGRPLSEIKQLLLRVFGINRATSIASTEITAAFWRGGERIAKLSGRVKAMQWFTAMDERVCSVCGAKHGELTPLGQTFSGGLYPPAHPYCRCHAEPVLI